MLLGEQAKCLFYGDAELRHYCHAIPDTGNGSAGQERPVDERRDAEFDDGVDLLCAQAVQPEHIQSPLPLPWFAAKSDPANID